MHMFKIFKYFKKAQIKNLKMYKMKQRQEKEVNILMKHKTQHNFKKVQILKMPQQQKQTHRH